MMRIEFSRRGADDLRALIGWYRETAPESLNRVLADINRSIDLLMDFPSAGEASPDGRFRHLVTRKYRYKLAYRVEADRVRIIGIFRYQQRDR